MTEIHNINVEETMRRILAAESAAVAAIPVSDAYERAVKTIVDRVHTHGGKVVTSGMGKAGQIALNIATTFSSTGTPAVYLHPGEAQHGDLGIIQQNDVLLLVSNSGQTHELLQLSSMAFDLYRKPIPIIVITGHEDSNLAKLADVVLFTGGAPEVCPLGLTPTVSTTAMTVMGDVLVVATMEAIGFTREEYAKRHHGGYLGKVARSEEPDKE